MTPAVAAFSLLHSFRAAIADGEMMPLRAHHDVQVKRESTLQRRNAAFFAPEKRH